MNAHQTTSLLLSIDPAAEPLAGTIGPVGGPIRGFCGYVELIGAVERARAAAGTEVGGVMPARSRAEDREGTDVEAHR
jgi:hypothetical protein